MCIRDRDRGTGSNMVAVADMASIMNACSSEQARNYGSGVADMLKELQWKCNHICHHVTLPTVDSDMGGALDAGPVLYLLASSRLRVGVLVSIVF
eukprot:3070160-Amphidinium_carterae.1